MKTLILVVLIGLKFFLQYVLISNAYELHRDEFLYLDQANHLAWGYLSVPPFTAWTSVIIQWLGNTVFWIKFFPALYGALTIYIVWKTIETLRGSLFALVLGATCVLFSALLRLNTLYQPNSLDVLCWTTIYYLLLKYVSTQHIKWLFTCALVMAIGLLNKYNIGFQIIGLIPALLLTERRRIFTQRGLYIAAGIVLLIVLPNLLWQYHNDFPVVHHMKELAATQLVNVNRLDFAKTQFLFFPGAIIVIIVSLYALLFYGPFKPYRFFLWTIIFTLAAFIYFKAKDYYAIGIYPIYIAFGAAYLGEVVNHGRKKYLQPFLLLFPLLLFIPLYQVGFPNKSPEYIIEHPEKYEKLGLLRWEDGKNHSIPQDFADMLGWKELAHKTDSLYAMLPDKNNTLILCDNYGQAGAINYYTRQNVSAVSFNADYINWMDLTRTYKNLIRIKEHGEWAEKELQETSPFFEHSILADSIVNLYAREHGTAIFVFTEAKIDISERIKSEIAEIKSKR